MYLVDRNFRFSIALQAGAAAYRAHGARQAAR